jgi:uncharacterized protein YkwD
VRGVLASLVPLLVVGWTFAVPAAPVVRAWDPGSFSASDEAQLFLSTNQMRAAAGLAPLRWDAQLGSLARWRVQDMSVRGYFAHEIPPDGYLAFHYMDLRGIQYVLAGEDIGWVSGVSDDQATPYVQQQFMDSPEHRSNILGAAWDSMGVGAYKGSDGAILFCVLFKESKPAATPRPTVNTADNGTTLHLALGQRFLLDLGSAAEWTVTVADPRIVGARKRRARDPGSPGDLRGANPWHDAPQSGPQPTLPLRRLPPALQTLVPPHDHGQVSQPNAVTISASD